jgi:hypothetical protein
VATVTEHSVPVNRYVTGPWRYERVEAVDHWVPVHAPDASTGCCWSSSSPEVAAARACGRRVGTVGHAC